MLLYISPAEPFRLPALGQTNNAHIVIGDFNSYSTLWGYTTTNSTEQSVEQWADLCIISLNTVVFRSYDLQFAYKKSCSNIQCVSMVTEVIDYYKKTMASLFICVCLMHPRLLI